ncbi:MAG TPA: hypothetical protein VE934_10030 [Polaromonas sp.]|uniref:hypothetical protein n=1 Tax=Polaromonas sp. TaxID=1869339 RepID=UPI002D520F40|nr:hypothetical protein [Polaromonas sp.]HYW57290.1 hypothetical protein [Polaromonas sp.]
MTTATSSHATPSDVDHRLHGHSFPRAWAVLIALCLALTALLVLLPDGVADPVQVLVGWLVVGIAAVVSIVTIVKVLERLLDCEAS